MVDRSVAADSRGGAAAGAAGAVAWTGVERTEVGSAGLAALGCVLVLISEWLRIGVCLDVVAGVDCVRGLE